MLRLEEYIAKRKIEDHLNEFDVEQKVNNIKTSIDYVFEYFNQYLTLEGVENHSPEENERLNKYENTLREYSPELKRWFVQMYDETGHQVNKTIMKFCDNVSGYFLIYEDKEFRSVSYNCYAELIKKRPCLRDQTEKLYQFIKEYHLIITKREYENFGFPKISEKITKWLESTYSKYNVNIILVVERYLDEFGDNIDMWPSGSRMKAERPYPGHPYEYNYRRRSNMFNVNGFYSKYGNKPFIKGMKKTLEILMLQKWINGYDGNDSDFFEEYLMELKDY